MVDTPTDFASRLRALRIERNLSQAELGNRVGVGQSAISQFEMGEKTPRLETLLKLALALDVSTSLLVEGREGNVA